MKFIVESGKGHACFARNYLRFTFGRWENEDADGCLLERMRLALQDGKPLAGMLEQVALAPPFQQRSFK